MAEVIAQKARRVLINTVASYDSSVVDKTAIIDSARFIAFLNKPMLSGNLDSFDIIEITNDLECALMVNINDSNFTNWKDYFDYLIEELSKG